MIWQSEYADLRAFHGLLA